MNCIVDDTAIVSFENVWAASYTAPFFCASPAFGLTKKSIDRKNHVKGNCCSFSKHKI